jgi:23S rRNA (uracil1939-C5)-methyltransferase
MWVPMNYDTEKSRCPCFGICGGCSLQQMPMDEQLKRKQAQLLDYLLGVRVESVEIMPPIEGPEWGYRHRARLAVKHVPKKGGVLVGFREKQKSYVVEMDGCEILTESISSLIMPLREMIESLTVYNRVPQVEVAAGDEVIALTLRHLEPLSEKDISILEAFSKDHAVSFYLQPRGPDSVVPLNQGSDKPLTYKLEGWNLEIEFGPLDFMQINPEINHALIRKTFELLDPSSDDRIADLFCGLGNFSLPLAALGARVEGFELVETQVERARENAFRNNLKDQACFEVQDLYSVAHDKAFLNEYSKILLDPPRSGAEEVVKSISSDGISRIVYVSCNPETLARDAQILVKQKGFALKKCGVVNMFPHTLHSEAIAMFDRA